MSSKLCWFSMVTEHTYGERFKNVTNHFFRIDLTQTQWSNVTDLKSIFGNGIFFRKFVFRMGRFILNSVECYDGPIHNCNNFINERITYWNKTDLDLWIFLPTKKNVSPKKSCLLTRDVILWCVHFVHH